MAYETKNDLIAHQERVIQALVNAYFHRKQDEEDAELVSIATEMYADSMESCNFSDCRHYNHIRRRCKLEECYLDYYDEDEH